MNQRFDEYVQTISAEYSRLGHSLGWRFLSVSKNVLNQDPGIAFISQNPAGTYAPDHHPAASCEQGCAYTVEHWEDYGAGQSPLQKQVQALYAGIAAKTGTGQSSLIESSLIGNFIPFRSPTMASLPRKRESREFGRVLWKTILSDLSSMPRLIICMSRDTYHELSDNILPDLGASRLDTSEAPVGWGTYTATIDCYEMANERLSVLRLPHLSRFAIFGRPQSRAQVDTILGKACLYLN